MNSGTSTNFRKVKDMLGRSVSIPNAPARIVSVVPSQTELLFNLGLEEEVAGVTKFCTHPKFMVARKAKVGGTKRLWLEAIREIGPDLIIANKEENTREDISVLEDKFPVWISDISNLNDALYMIREVGVITSRKEEAARLAEDIEREFTRLLLVGRRRKNVLYLIWKSPYMTIGSDTFIHDMLERMGLDNVIADDIRYPEIAEERIRELRPDFIFLSSEPYPFKEVHVAELQKISPGSKVVGVDGEMFSWYGSRLQYAPAYFRELQELM